MAIFSYTARDAKNIKVKGKVEARDERHAVSVLRERAMVVITLKMDREGMTGSLFDQLTNRVSKEDVGAFTQQLATMLGAGLPLTEGLEMLRLQTKPGLAKVLSEILHDVQGGASLGEAMNRHPGVFSTVYVALVKTGEASGKLDTVLLRLAESEEKQRQFRSKTKGAMVYPAIVMVAMVVVVLVMMIFVVPQMTQMYDSFGAELPFTTQILIGTSDIIRKTWWLLAIIAGGGMLFFKEWYKTPQGRMQIDALTLKVPIFGKLRTEIIMTEFSMTLSLLVAAGISILEGLEIVTAAVDNMVYKEALERVSKGVEKGLPLATMLARQQIFPPLLSQMVSVGEETGELETVLIKVARYFEQVAEQTIKNLTTAIEPLIMVVLGVVVGFIVFAIITPLYKITEMF